MGFDFTVIAPLVPSHCGFSFVFGCGVSSLVSSSVFLSMIVQQLVVILVFSQEGVCNALLVATEILVNVKIPFFLFEVCMQSFISLSLSKL